MFVAHGIPRPCVEPPPAPETARRSTPLSPEGLVSRVGRASPPPAVCASSSALTLNPPSPAGGRLVSGEVTTVPALGEALELYISTLYSVTIPNLVTRSHSYLWVILGLSHTKSCYLQIMKVLSPAVRSKPFISFPPRARLNGGERG